MKLEKHKHQGYIKNIEGNKANVFETSCIFNNGYAKLYHII